MSRPTVRLAPSTVIPPMITTAGSKRTARSSPNRSRQRAHQRQGDRVARQVDEEQVGAGDGGADPGRHHVEDRPPSWGRCTTRDRRTLRTNTAWNRVGSRIVSSQSASGPPISSPSRHDEHPRRLIAAAQPVGQHAAEQRARSARDQSPLAEQARRLGRVQVQLARDERRSPAHDAVQAERDHGARR